MLPENKPSKKSLLNKYKPRAYYRNFTAYYYIETIYCRLLLRIARMEMDWNLKKKLPFFTFFQD